MEDFLLNPGSYLWIVLILVATGCGLPLPEEVPIIGAGVACSLGHLEAAPALMSCLVGALLGDSMLYAIGYHFGRNLVNAHPRLAHLLHAEREARMETLINRHGLKVLFVARFMVFVRAPVYLSIGILRHSYRKFVLIDTVCASAVVGLFFGLSYLCGENVTKWVRDSEKVLTVVVLAAVLVGVLVFWVRRRKARLPSIEQVLGDPPPAEQTTTCVQLPLGDAQTGSQTDEPKQHVNGADVRNGNLHEEPGHTAGGTAGPAGRRST